MGRPFGVMDWGGGRPRILPYSKILNPFARLHSPDSSCAVFSYLCVLFIRSKSKKWKFQPPRILCWILPRPNSLPVSGQYGIALPVTVFVGLVGRDKLAMMGLKSVTFFNTCIYICTPAISLLWIFHGHLLYHCTVLYSHNAARQDWHTGNSLW